MVDVCLKTRSENTWTGSRFFLSDSEAIQGNCKNKERKQSKDKWIQSNEKVLFIVRQEGESQSENEIEGRRRDSAIGRTSR